MLSKCLGDLTRQAVNSDLAVVPEHCREMIRIRNALTTTGFGLCS